MTASKVGHELPMSQLMDMLNRKAAGQTVVEFSNHEDGIVLKLSGGSVIAFHRVEGVAYAELQPQPCSTVIQ